MKKSVKASKRILSLFMALIIVSTAFVFAFPASAECEYHITQETNAARRPTCYEDGWTSELVCLICKETVQKSTVLKKFDHIYNKWEIDTQAHTATTECILCKNIETVPVSIDVTDSEAHEHIYSSDNYVTILESTCTSTGIKALACTICGNIDGIHFFEIPRKPHEYEEEEYIRQYPTCEDVKITYKVCLVCKHEEDIYGGALGHTWSDWEVTFKGSCKEKGYEERFCDRCKSSQRNDFDKLGSHIYEVLPYVAPTCFTTGLSIGYRCTVCGYIDKEQEEIPALKHVDEDGNLSCDLCGTAIKCNCICHNTTGIGGLVAKFVLFVWKLIGISQKCKCGIEHYSIYKPE